MTLDTGIIKTIAGKKNKKTLNCKDVKFTQELSN